MELRIIKTSKNKIIITIQKKKQIKNENEIKNVKKIHNKIKLTNKNFLCRPQMHFWLKEFPVSTPCQRFVKRQERTCPKLHEQSVSTQG